MNKQEKETRLVKEDSTLETSLVADYVRIVTEVNSNLNCGLYPLVTVSSTKGFSLSKLSLFRDWVSQQIFLEPDGVTYHLKTPSVPYFMCYSTSYMAGSFNLQLLGDEIVLSYQPTDVNPKAILTYGKLVVMGGKIQIDFQTPDQVVYSYEDCADDVRNLNELISSLETRKLKITNLNKTGYSNTHTTNSIPLLSKVIGEIEEYRDLLIETKKRDVLEEAFDLSEMRDSLTEE